MQNATETTAAQKPVRIPVSCDAEQKVVGHLEVLPGDRPKVLQPQLAMQHFDPAESKYAMGQKQPKAGAYWHCPHCGAHLCLAGEVSTGEAYPEGHPKAGQLAPPIKEATMQPVVLGRTRFYAR